mmetsp:Transcript_30151/g.40049  ORF Transcript_30151/g.40049 Transcript_30151/m.40049 type:complete len:115 (+) Transcript_30151:5206-5550(+)
MRSGGKKSPRGHASNVTAPNMTATNMTGMERGYTPGRLSGIPSASVTAKTVFQGLNNIDSASQLKVNRGVSYDPNMALTNSFQAQMNNLVNDSPVTMMDMSEEKGAALGGAGNM